MLVLTSVLLAVDRNGNEDPYAKKDEFKQSFKNIFQIMMDIKKDKRLADQWINGVAKASLDSETMADLAQSGIQTCEGYCGSREYTGEDRCRCVREIFPSYADYKLYLEARNRFKKLYSMAMLGQRVSQETKGRENND